MKIKELLEARRFNSNFLRSAPNIDDIGQMVKDIEASPSKAMLKFLFPESELGPLGDFARPSLIRDIDEKFDVGRYYAVSMLWEWIVDTPHGEVSIIINKLEEPDTAALIIAKR